MNQFKSALARVLPNKVFSHLQAMDHYLHGEPELRLIAQLCTSGRDAIDAGANIGTYTYFLRRHARTVFAFEPNPGLAKRSGELFPDVKVHYFALSDREGDVVLKIPLDSDGHHRHELASIAQDFDGMTQDVHVKAITIDSECFQNVGFLKIDVEQHEREVLRGAMETIRRCRPIILTEVSPLKYDVDLPTAFSFITQNDYLGWFRFAKTWLPFSAFSQSLHSNSSNFGVKEKFMGGNVLFFPAEHSLAQCGPH